MCGGWLSHTMSTIHIHRPPEYTYQQNNRYTQPLKTSCSFNAIVRGSHSCNHYIPYFQANFTTTFLIRLAQLSSRLTFYHLNQCTLQPVAVNSHYNYVSQRRTHFCKNLPPSLQLHVSLNRYVSVTKINIPSP